MWAARTRMAASNIGEFIQSTWSMVNDGHDEIRWSEDGTTITVLNAERLAEHLLPRYFKHAQYASWVRALNAYDFKKSGAGRWSHPSFVRGHPELLPNIRRKVAASRRARPPAAPSETAATSTALVRKRAPTSPDLQARQQLWWMQQELARLQGEVGAIRAEDFQQRFDTVRLMQAMLTHLASVQHPPPADPQIVLNPAVISTHSTHVGANQLTYKEHVDEGGAGSSGGGSSCGSGRGGREGSGSGSSPLPLPPPVDASALALDLESETSLTGTLLARQPSSPPVIEEDGMLRLDVADGMDVAGSGAAAEDGMERLWTSAAPSLAASAGEHNRQMLPASAANATANILGAFADSPASATALKFLLARMPPLPASTAQLPPRGTVQRQHIEAAIELAFRQLTITADQALAQRQQAGS